MARILFAKAQISLNMRLQAWLQKPYSDALLQSHSTVTQPRMTGCPECSLWKLIKSGIIASQEAHRQVIRATLGETHRDLVVEVMLATVEAILATAEHHQEPRVEVAPAEPREPKAPRVMAAETDQNVSQTMPVWHVMNTSRAGPVKWLNHSALIPSTRSVSRSVVESCVALVRRKEAQSKMTANALSMSAVTMTSAWKSL